MGVHESTEMITLGGIGKEPVKVVFVPHSPDKKRKDENVKPKVEKAREDQADQNGF